MKQQSKEEYGALDVGEKKRRKIIMTTSKQKKMVREKKWEEKQEEKKMKKTKLAWLIYNPLDLRFNIYLVSKIMFSFLFLKLMF